MFVTAFFERRNFMHRTKFIPRILLCGDEADFLARIDSRPFKIIGYAKIFGEVDGQKFDFRRDGKIFFNGELQDFDALKKFLLGSDVDYLVFTESKTFKGYNYYAYLHGGFLSAKTITLEQLKATPHEFFFDANIAPRLLSWTKKLSVNTLLDFDGFFAASKVFTKPANDFTQIDCITEKTLPPIAENIYRRVYKNLAEVGLQKYDAVFLTERDPQDFDAACALTQNMSDGILTYARTNSALEKHINDSSKIFSAGAEFFSGAEDFSAEPPQAVNKIIVSATSSAPKIFFITTPQSKILSSPTVRPLSPRTFLQASTTPGMNESLPVES